MAIDVRVEKLLTLGQLARRVPRRREGRPVAPSTLWRWHRVGVQIGGRRVYLEALRSPSGAASTLGALQRFLEQISGGGDPANRAQAPTRVEVSEAVDELNADKI
jgi:hypothetical protein